MHQSRRNRPFPENSDEPVFFMGNRFRPAELSGSFAAWIAEFDLRYRIQASKSPSAWPNLPR